MSLSKLVGRLIQQVSFADESIRDAFGRIRTSEPANRFDVEFIYNKQEEIIDEITAGAGTASHQANTRDVLLTVGSLVDGDQAELRSYPVPYTPGNSQLIDITGVLNYANISGTAEIFVRTKTSGTVAETTYPQSTWDSNTTGVNWQYSQIYSMDFQSLKVGRIRFGLVQNGSFQLVKEVYNDNIRTPGYWQNPNLSIRWIVRNTASAQITEIMYGDNDNGIGFRFTHAAVDNTDVSCLAICATVKSEGGLILQDIPGFTRSISRGTSFKSIGATMVPLISIRPRSTYNSLPNLSLSLPTGFEITTDNPIYYKIVHDVSLTGATWNNVDTTESTMEYDVSATAYTNGHVIKEGIINGNRNSAAEIRELLGRVVLWHRQSNETGITSILCERVSATASVGGGFTWKEIR